MDWTRDEPACQDGHELQHHLAEAEAAKQDGASPLRLQDNDEDDAVIDLAACQEQGPWLTLILPDQNAAEASERLSLVTADEEDSEEAAGADPQPRRFDSSAFTSFSEWTQQ